MPDRRKSFAVRTGRLDSVRGTQVVAQTPVYDHCNFTVLDGAPVAATARFRELLLGMSYADPDVRPLLGLEGLKKWLPGRTEGYALLAEAVGRSRYRDSFVGFLSRQCG